jgi:hypothetical protein
MRLALLGWTDECVRPSMDIAQVHYFFGQGEDAWFAGDYQEAVRGVAAGPARPLEAARVYRAIEAVAG